MNFEFLKFWTSVSVCSERARVRLTGGRWKIMTSDGAPFQVVSLKFSKKGEEET